MINTSNRPPRPNLTGPIFLYALADVFGLACVGIGASWFVAGKGAIIANFPTSVAEAVACTAGGAAVMLWAVSRNQHDADARLLAPLNRRLFY